MRSANTFIAEYNEFAEVDTGSKTESIDPHILNAVVTMVQEYGKEPISAQRPFIEQVRKLPDVEVMGAYIKRNDTIFADAPQSGVPVVVTGYSSGSYESVVDGLEKVTDLFIKGVGLRLLSKGLKKE